jgi:hypothetical protein
VKEMTQERIKEIAEVFLQDLDEGFLFITWDDIRSALRNEEDMDETTLEILTDKVLDEIENIVQEKGALYYYPGETYIYDMQYHRARAGGITIIFYKKEA